MVLFVALNTLVCGTGCSPRDRGQDMTFARNTPVSDIIAAQIAAAGGDRRFAEGATYRRGGINMARWLAHVAEWTPPGYVVRESPIQGTKYTCDIFRIRQDGSEKKISAYVDPERMDGEIVREMIRLYERGIAHEQSRQRLEALAARPAPAAKRRARAVEPEEAAAPAMGR
jgi:hypothetical protein